MVTGSGVTIPTILAVMTTLNCVVDSKKKMLSMPTLFRRHTSETVRGGKGSQTHAGSGSRPVYTAAQPQVGHTLTEFFCQVSRRLCSATNTSWFYLPP